MIRIYALKLKESEFSSYELSSLLNYVSSTKKEKILKYRNKLDAMRSLYADLLIRHLISKSFSIKNKDIELVVNKYGKPYFKKHDFNFNLSHSGFWIVCVIGSNSIGIDVEEVKDINLNIAKVFSKEEYDFLRLIKGKKERISTFFKLWTLKESVVKALGKGLSIPLDSFSIDSIDKEPKVKFMGLVDAEYKLRNVDFDDGYELSICTFGNDNFDGIYFMDIHEVVNSCKV
ncbi:4'-phosphopantetheinyl transferase family protein [Shouchella patagoniensis]|uniref:4'-phosphopantetheinyl transferase family protein n=1 Tax=Shouchella patagoniensis TaxID=228576 RepID=UPI00099547A9|nr:4'-phosphopantetheinyl transferase superfamily protein [Shouchella patagoniensis]